MSNSKCGKYKPIEDTTSTKITTCKLTGKKYYFKVKAYKKVNNKKVYSDCSLVKYINVK